MTPISPVLPSPAPSPTTTEKVYKETPTEPAPITVLPAPTLVLLPPAPTPTDAAPTPTEVIYAEPTPTPIYTPPYTAPYVAPAPAPTPKVITAEPIVPITAPAISPIADLPKAISQALQITFPTIPEARRPLYGITEPKIEPIILSVESVKEQLSKPIAGIPTWIIVVVAIILLVALIFGEK